MKKIFQKIFKSFQLFFQIWIIEKGILGKKLDKGMMVLFGPIYFQTLNAAVRLDLFTKLGKQGALTKAEIAKQLDIEIKPASILVTVLVAIGFLKRSRKNGDFRYKNTMLADIFLDKNKQTNITAIIGWYHHIVYKPMFWFTESLQANTNLGLKEIPGVEENLYQRMTHHPQLERVFESAMEQLSLTANKMLTEFVDLSNIKHIVDVGGGNGTNIMALARKNPHLKATVFDSPTVCALADENIAKHGMKEFCNTFQGNCFIDNFPKDADCFLFSHFLDIWSEEENALLTRKSYEALPKGGQIIILDNPLWENERGSFAAAASAPYFLGLASGHAHIYTANDFEKWLRDAGFEKVRRIRLPQEHVAIIGIK